MLGFEGQLIQRREHYEALVREAENYRKVRDIQQKDTSTAESSTFRKWFASAAKLNIPFTFPTDSQPDVR